MMSWSFLSLRDSTEVQAVGQDTRINPHFPIWIIIGDGWQNSAEQLFLSEFACLSKLKHSMETSVLTKLQQNPAWFPASLSAWLLGWLLARLPWNQGPQGFPGHWLQSELPGSWGRQGFQIVMKPNFRIKKPPQNRITFLYLALAVFFFFVIFLRKQGDFRFHWNVFI